jgi:hypothetical protein
MTTAWKIVDTTRDISTGLIIEITYLYEAILSSELSRTISTLNVTGDPTSPNFIEFTDLTEQTILQWVKSALGQQQVNEIETNVQAEVTAMQAAADAVTVKHGLPWSID